DSSLPDGDIQFQMQKPAATEGTRAFVEVLCGFSRRYCGAWAEQPKKTPFQGRARGTSLVPSANSYVLLPPVRLGGRPRVVIGRRHKYVCHALCRLPKLPLAVARGVNANVDLTHHRQVGIDPPW